MLRDVLQFLALLILLTALALALWLAHATTAFGEEAACRPLGRYRITGYVRGHGAAHTYDGTSVWTSEKIVAASWNLPLGARIRVEGLDYEYRVADRGGGLSERHIDVLVDSVAAAYAIEAWTDGGYAEVCLVIPQGEDRD